MMNWEWLGSAAGKVAVPALVSTLLAVVLRMQITRDGDGLRKEDFLFGGDLIIASAISWVLYVIDKANDPKAKDQMTSLFEYSAVMVLVAFVLIVAGGKLMRNFGWRPALSGRSGEIKPLALLLYDIAGLMALGYVTMEMK
jgi:hypothetical protein